MGNRAVITTAPFDENNVGIYVHWNGGRESIEGFLDAAKALGYRPPGTHASYAFAGLAGLIWSYLGRGGLSVGIGQCKDLDCENWDNGVWLIGPEWEIVGQHSGVVGADVIPPEKFDPLTADDEEKRKAICADILANVRVINALRETAA